MLEWHWGGGALGHCRLWSVGGQGEGETWSGAQACGCVQLDPGLSGGLLDRQRVREFDLWARGGEALQDCRSGPGAGRGAHGGGVVEAKGGLGHD